MDCIPPGFSVHGIFQARTLEWVAISFSRGSSPTRDRTWISCVAGRFFTTKPPEGEGNGTPLQCSCLENPMDRGAWWAAVHGVAKSRTWLSNFTFTFHFHALEKEMATHSSVLACRIPGTVEPGGLLSVGLHWVKHDWSDLAAAAAASHLGRPILYSRTSFIHSVYNTSKWLWCLIEHLDGYWTTPLFIIFLWPYLS